MKVDLMPAPSKESRSVIAQTRLHHWLICLLPLLLVSCAKTAEPHPPEILVPKPATNLAATEYGEQILLTVSMPTVNTNGSPMTTLREIQLLRLTEEQRTQSKPVPEADFLKSAVPVLVIPVDKVSDYLSNQTLSFHDELLNIGRSKVYDSGFRYAVRFVNKKKQSAGLSNQVLVAPIPIPPAPSGVKTEVSQREIRVLWESPAENLDGSTPPRILGYNVYRTEDPKKFPPAPMNADLLQRQEFDDRTFEFDKTYYYAISIVASREKPYAETKVSGPAQVTPRDTFPPGAPENLNSVVTDGTVLLLWASPPDNDLAGYRITRAESGNESGVALQPGLVAALSYRDDKVERGKRYTYRVIAVDKHGNQSAPAEVEVDMP
jgi:hypothetical protein